MALFRRNQIYWYKRRVPNALREALGKLEVRVTLRTKDLNEAQKRAKEVELEFDLAWKPMLAQIDKETRTEAHLRAAARLMGFTIP